MRVNKYRFYWFLTLCILVFVPRVIVAQTRPTTQAQITSSGTSSSSSITLNWTNGNGTSRILIGVIGNAVDFTPTDNVTYSASSTWGSGTAVTTNFGTGYVLYNGTGTFVSLNNLSGNTSQYTFRIYEYNGSAGSEKYLSTSSPSVVPNCATGGGGGGSNCYILGNPFTWAYHDGTNAYPAVNVVYRNVTLNSVDVYYTSRGRSFLAGSTSQFTGTVSGSTKYCADLTFGVGASVPGTNGNTIFNFTDGCSGYLCDFSSGNTTPVSVIGLVSNTKYDFRAFSSGGGGCASSWLNSATPGNGLTPTTWGVWTKPSVASSSPSFSNTSATTTTLNWTSGNGFRRIIVASLAVPAAPVDGIIYTSNQLTTGSSTFGEGSLISSDYVVYDGTGNSVTINGLSANTSYTFSIYEYNNPGTYATGYGVATTASVTTTPNSPVASAATSLAQTSFSANWGASAGATGYRLDVSTANTFGTFVSGYNNLAVAGTSSAVTGLSSGTTYYYRVRAESGAGASTSSSTITALTIPANPTVSLSGSSTQNSFFINANSTGATDFRLDVSTDNFTSTLPAYSNQSIGTTMPYAITGLTAGTAYQWRVRGSNASGTSANSSAQNALTLPPNPVTVSATSITQTSYIANWNTAASATSYRLDVATDNLFTTILSGYNNASVAGTSSSVTGLASGTTYYYRVRAVNASGTSNNSNITSALTIPANPVATSASSITASSFTANWNTVTGASSYTLDYSVNSNLSSPTTISNISGNTTSLSGLSANTTYYYAVRAINSTGASSNSNSINLLTLTVAPVATSATSVSASGFTANWNAVAGATSYRLDVAPDNTFSSFVTNFNNASVSGTNASVSGLTSGTNYYYRVRAVNVSGSSVNSNVITQILIPPAPVATNASLAGSDSFTANWQAATGAVSYRLDVSTDNFLSYVSGYNDLAVTTVSSNVTGLVAGTTYQYRVRAINTAGTSANSNQIAIETIPSAPAIQAASAISSSGFTANWSSATGATQYLLDISTDNFVTFISGYNSQSLTTLTEVVTSLLPNTTYQYRVRASNTSGVSANSASASVLTISSAPVATAASGILQSGFTANWNAITGITNFRLDVSDDNFVTRISGFDDLAVTGTSKNVNGLISGKNYQYRLRAVNTTGISGNSNEVSAVTIPSNPVALAATAISQTGFTANWNLSSGANSYFLDVSVASNFSTFITGYEGKLLTSNVEVLSELSNGATYYYRVRSQNSSGISSNSNVISQITIPANPIANTVVTKSSNSFFASWTTVPGASGYELEVTLFSANFASLVTGYNPKVIADPAQAEDLIIGLEPSTAYSYRLRAINAGGKSGNSNVKSMITDAGSGGPTPVFTASLTSFNSGQFSGSAVTVQGQYSNALGSVTGNLFYKGITESTYKQKALTISNGGYSVTVDEIMLDELGVQFYAKLKDQTDAEKTTNEEKIFRTYTSSTSPLVVNSNFEGTRASIRMISIPLDLKDNLIESIFASLGVYDKKSWRLAHYEEGQGNVEFREGINKIERGLGYWFNARGSVNVKSGEGSVGVYTESNPFKISLVPGWNQIGNPFPFAIDWSDVLADNPTAVGVGGLRVYNGSKANYESGNKMEPFTGGFIQSDNNVTLDIKVSLKSRANGGRYESTENFDLSEDSWRLPITIEQNGSVYSLGGIGMEPDAKDSKDKFDEIRLPRLEEYVDVTFEHPEYRFKNFTVDIKPTQEESSWQFFVAGHTSDSHARIVWDNSLFGNNSIKVALLDVEAAQWVDMRSVSHYTFNNPGRKEFKIYYSKNEITPDEFTVSAPYPNTTPLDFTVSLTLPARATDHQVEVKLYDLMGKPSAVIFQGEKPSGVHSIVGAAQDNIGNKLPAGVYLVRTKVDNRYLVSHRIVIN